MKTTTTERLRVQRLQVKNIMRLRAADLELDPNVNRVIGPNGSGKTTLLSCIQMALAGPKAAPGEPITAGEKKAEIILDLGKYQVKRSFTAGGMYITLIDAEGREVKSPQKVLDALYSELACDPLAFMREKPKDQAATLSRLAGLDFAEVDAMRKRAYEDRTIANREVEQIRAAVRTLPLSVPFDTPEKEVDGAELAIKLGGLHKRRADRARWERNVADARERVDEVRKELEAVTKRLTEILEDEQPAVSQEDIDAVSDALAKAETTNKNVRLRDARRREEERLAEAEKRAADLDQRIELIDKRKRDLLAAAELPIKGLEWDEDGVRYNGQPLAQASHAEQIRISVAIAVAMNPTVRTVLVRDASLLDDRSMELLIAAAEEFDAQLFLELIDSDEPGIFLCDGVAEKADTAPARRKR
jgi:DNA repair exonuclease SbcCD ATPase subunit